MYSKSPVYVNMTVIGVRALKELRKKYFKFYLPPLKGADVAEGGASRGAEDYSTVRLPVCTGLSC